MFGLSPDSSELLTESRVERLPPDDLAVVRRAMTACLVHQRSHGPAGPYPQGRLNVEIAGSDLVAGMGGILLGRFPHGPHEVAFAPPEAELVPTPRRVDSATPLNRRHV
jgi:hypothetical protein